LNVAIKAVEDATRVTKIKAFVPIGFGGEGAYGKKRERGSKKTFTGNLKPGEGELRYIAMALDIDNPTRVALTLVWNAESFAGAQPGLARLVKELGKSSGGLFSSIYVNLNASAGNVVLSTKAGAWSKVYGAEFTSAKIGGSSEASGGGKLYFTPATFRQGNYFGFQAVIDRIVEIARARESKKITELYAGVGCIGLGVLAALGDRVEELRCSDENVNNRRCFDKAVGSLLGEVSEGDSRRGGRERKGGERERDRARDRERVSYTTGSAADVLERGGGERCDTLIVDPPRSGLEEGVVGALCEKSGGDRMLGQCRTLIYVSCGFDALSRDLDAILTANAGWKVEVAEGYLLFPGSNHVETVVVLTRP
jgi:hypothetical protein